MAAAMAHSMLLGASVALSLAILLIVARDGRLAVTARVTVMALCIAGIAYGVLSAPWPVSTPAWVRLLLAALAGCGVVALWSLVRLLFDPDYLPAKARRQPVILVTLAILAPALVGAVVPAARPVFAALLAILAVLLAIHLFWILLAGRQDDLDPYRRRLRLMLAGGGGAYVLAVLVAQGLGLGATKPGLAAQILLAAQIAFKLIWLALTLGNPSPLAILYRITQTAPPSPLAPVGENGNEPEAPGPASAGEPRSTLAEAGLMHHGRQLLAAMEERHLHRRQDLTIARLGEQVGLPEHRLRAVITHLGFRNYTAFINHFRLREVASRMRDPAADHLPILTLALDAGYASLGPFNRAFRAGFEQSPSEYRNRSREPR